ncbi:MAG TPA: hypothetical protein VKZ85_16450 [Woeseiaceae bacterium]|nr:hypothetical protein [Woeseiaceae bacterium]
MTEHARDDARVAEAARTVESLDGPRLAQEARAERRIATEDLEAIVRRAAEIQNRRGSPGAASLTEAEVIEIGRQVGLEPDSVRRAIAEVRAESLAPRPPAGNRLFDALVGEGRVEVRRVVAGEPARIQQQVELLLRDREKLQPLRRRLGRSVWEASTGTMARLERFLNFSGREYALAEIRQVDLAVAEIEPGWSLVTLAGDVGNKRDEVLGGLAGGVLVLAAVAAVLVGEDGSWAAGVAAGLGAALVAAALGIPWARRSLEQRRQRIVLLLEGLVDRADGS